MTRFFGGGWVAESLFTASSTEHTDGVGEEKAVELVHVREDEVELEGECILEVAAEDGRDERAMVSSAALLSSEARV